MTPELPDQRNQPTPSDTGNTGDQANDLVVTGDADDQEFTLHISCEPPGDIKSLFGLSEETLLNAIELTMRAVGVAASVEVSLLVSDDAGIRALNARYRGRDEATDVLSFPQLDAPLVDAPEDQLWQTHDDAPETPAIAAATSGATPTAASVASTLGPNADEIEAAESLQSLESLLEDDLQGVPDDANDDEFDELDDAEDWEDEPGGEFAFDSDEWPLHLGDIALARETVARQAQQAGHSVAWEAAYLFVHGVLHLVGYDDQTEAGYQTMVALQTAILDRLGVSR